MSDRNLFISPEVKKLLHPAQLDAIELAGLDCSYQTVEKIWANELVDRLTENPVDSAICTVAEYQELGRGLKGNAGQFPHLYPLPKSIILLNSGEGSSYPFPNHLRMPQIRYTVGATTPLLLRGLIGSVLEFQVNAQAATGYRGVLPRIATGQGIETETTLLRSSSQRSEIQQFVAEFCKQALKRHKALLSHGYQHYIKSMSEILDELLMNAIWDANPEYNHLKRSETCLLEQGKEVRIECSCDGVNLALCVEDKQGTFPWEALSGPLSFSLGMKPELKVNEGPGGAGLGLYMILQRTSILSFEVKRDTYTRVTAVLRLDESARDMQTRPKSLLIFENEMYEHKGCHT